MRVTRNSVLIETTHRVNGMLEQGGVVGRVVAYPRMSVAALLRVGAATLASIDEDAALESDDDEAGIRVTVREMIERNIRGRVVRRGTVVR